MKIEEISHENPATPSKKPSFHCEPLVIYILQHWYQITLISLIAKEVGINVEVDKLQNT